MAARDSPLRILHAPVDIAGQASALVHALRRIGVAADGLSYEADRYGFGGMAPAYPHRVPPFGWKQVRQAGHTWTAARRYDVLHAHFGRSLLPGNRDLILLRSLGKPTVMHFWGSEIRLLREAAQRNPWIGEAGIPDRDAEKIRLLRRLARWARAAIVGDAELNDYVKDYFDQVEVVRQAVDLERYPPTPPSPEERAPRVVHVPSERGMKGTRYVEEAVRRLRKGHDIEFELVTGKAHVEAMSALARADIVVDQLLVGTYGILAVEAMAMAKPVIGYIREDLRPRYPPNLPILSATPATVEDRLESLVADGGLRWQLGVAGRRYAEENHDALRVADQLATIYRSLVAGA